MKYLFIVLCLSCLITEIHAAPPNPYEAFDSSIYDQSKLKPFFHAVQISPDTINRPDIQAVILENLSFQKITLLNRRVFQAIDKKLEDVKTLQEKYKKGIGSKILSASSKAATGVGAGLLFLGVPGVGEVIGAEMIAGISLGGVGALAGGIQDFIDPDGNVDIERLRTQFEREKQECILKMNDEPQVADLEIRYILLKPLLANAELEKTIEERLIALRRNTVMNMEFCRAFLENCLRIPFGKKQVLLPNPHKLLEADQEVPPDLLTEKQTQALGRLRNYLNQDLRNELQRMILTLQMASKKVSSEECYARLHRRFFYFYGDPGTGKSTAAKDIAVFLGLPFHETNIRTGDDISQSALEGTDWIMPNASLGHFGNAFTASSLKSRATKTICCRLKVLSEYGVPPNFSLDVPEDVLEHTYQNPILIINDFDRLLLDPQTATQTLSFFLDYLDPQKDTFFNNYFNLKLPLENLFIVVTGNSKDFLQDPRYAALLDRITPIEFPYLEESVREKILEKNLSSVTQNYELEDITTEEQQSILRQARAKESVRSGKKLLETLVLDIKRMRPPALEKAASPQQADHRAFQVEPPSYDLDHVFLPMTSLPSLFSDEHQRHKVRSLQDIWRSTQKLHSSRASEQKEAISDLLGTYHWYKNSWGYIQCFWETRRWRTYSEFPGSTQALANRLHRLEPPKDRYEMIEAHINVLNNLVSAFLDIKKPLEDPKDGAFLFGLIKADSVKQRNLKYLRKHLECFSTETSLERSFARLLEKVPLDDSGHKYLLLEPGTKKLLKSFALFLGDTRLLERFDDRLGELIAVEEESDHQQNNREEPDEDTPLIN